MRSVSLCPIRARSTRDGGAPSLAKKSSRCFHSFERRSASFPLLHYLADPVLFSSSARDPSVSNKTFPRLDGHQPALPNCSLPGRVNVPRVDAVTREAFVRALPCPVVEQAETSNVGHLSAGGFAVGISLLHECCNSANEWGRSTGPIRKLQNGRSLAGSEIRLAPAGHRAGRLRMLPARTPSNF
jgi:hypothetical protein